MSMVVTNSDKGNETDTDNGSVAGGVTSDTYNDVGGSSITQKTTMSENATSSGQDIQSSGQSAFTTIATQTITSNASGSDATPPGGVTAPANGGGTDANNPDVLGGFATADQKSGYTITITNSDVRSRSGTTTGGVNSYLGIFSAGDTASYKASANATISSNSVIDVNQAQGINTRNGNQNDDASETQTADYKLNYSQTLPGIGTLAGGGQSHSVHNGYNDTDGPYGTGTDTNQTGASTVITGTWWQTPGQPSSGGGTYTTGFSNKTTLAAAPAPEGQPGVGAWAAPSHTAPNPFQLACFAGGTPVRTPDGWKAIEEVLPGDLVLASPDTDPESGAEPKPVVRVYANPPARLISVHVGGQVIRATLDHPFYVRGSGWAGASRLRPGDELLSDDGHWHSVTETYDNGDVEPVYNLSVQDHHTYFVGKPDWGRSVLVHNQSRAARATRQRGSANAAAPRIEGGDEIAFSSLKGPVKAIGIVGGGEKFSDLESGVQQIIGKLSVKALANNSQVYPTEVFGSKGGADPQREGFNNNLTAQDIANNEFAKMKLAQKALGPNETYRLAIIGYSAGAGKAIEVANRLRDLINNERTTNHNPGFKAAIALRTIDGWKVMKSGSEVAVKGTPLKPIAKGPAAKTFGVSSWWNWFEKFPGGDYHGNPLNQSGAKDIEVEGKNHYQIGKSVVDEVVNSLIP